MTAGRASFKPRTSSGRRARPATSTMNEPKTRTTYGRCPKCGEALDIRHNQTTGEPFLACTNYPTLCRYTDNLGRALATVEFQRAKLEARVRELEERAAQPGFDVLLVGADEQARRVVEAERHWREADAARRAAEDGRQRAEADCAALRKRLRNALEEGNRFAATIERLRSALDSERARARKVAAAPLAGKDLLDTLQRGILTAIKDLHPDRGPMDTTDVVATLNNLRATVRAMAKGQG